MTKYTVTIAQTDDNMNPTGEIETLTGRTLSEAKNIQKLNCGSIVTFQREAKVIETPKTWYYRGAQVEIVEGRQNGWTMVNNIDGSNLFYFAVTSEMEYR